MSGGTLRFAANMGLAHMWCDECHEERLHHRMRCASCKTLQRSARHYKAGNWGEFQVKSRLNRRTRELRGLG